MKRSNIQLSKRLQAVTAMVPRCSCVADVGCDHGYISIFLVQQGVAHCAIAMDIRKGPLERAQEHISRQQLASYIQVRLSDGLQKLKPREADVIVIAGMGGATMEQILREGRELLTEGAVLVLQPQSEILEFRRFLTVEGYRIAKEDMVLEEGKYYPIMQVCLEGRDGSIRYRNEELAFGPLLLRQRHPVLHQYLNWRQEQLEKILLQVKAHAGSEAGRRRIQELEEELACIGQGLAYYRA